MASDSNVVPRREVLRAHCEPGKEESMSQQKLTLGELVLQAAGAIPRPARAPDPEQPVYASLAHEEEAIAAEKAAAAERAAAVAAARQQPLGRTVLGTIANLDAMIVQDMFRRPPEPEPVNLNSPGGKLKSFVGRLIGGGTR